MKINATQAATLFPAPATTLTGQADFQATLESSRQNLALNATTPTKTAESISESAQVGEKTAIQELEEYLKKNPIQRMREAILKSMGLTEADLDAMPPEKRDVVEAAVEARIKEYLLGDKAQAQLNSISSAAMRPQTGAPEIQAGLTDVMGGVAI